MMKRYLPVIFTIFAIIFTHGHAVAADVTPNAPDLIGCTVTACDNTSPYQEVANCATTICKKYTQSTGITAEVYSCDECDAGYKRTKKSELKCGNTYIILYKCDLEYINCTNKCNSCDPTTTTISTYYTKKINRSCTQVDTACECVQGTTTYSCSTNALQTADTVNCNGSNCSGCSICPTGATCNGTKTFTCPKSTYKTDTECKACPTGATCDGSETFRCNSGFYKPQNSNSCTQCPNNATCNDGINFKCNDGFYKSGSSCASCPAYSTCTSKTDFTCNNGYCASGNKCEKLPDNAKCVDGVIKCNKDFYKSGNSCKSCGSIIIGSHTIQATSNVGATSKSDCTFTNVNTDISEVKFYPNKEDINNFHKADIKIKSCY